MKTPVYDALLALKEENSISFHFPGHKGHLAGVPWGELMPAIDTTETEGMDNLLEPKGIIKQSQKEAAKIFGAKETLYAVNGSTGSIYIAMAAFTKPGDRVIVQRNCHKSVYNAMVLNRLKPAYVYPRYNEDYDLLSGVSAEDVQYALDLYPEAKALILTYPNYYGVCCDLETIAHLVHEAGKILMVDEAHGAHFTFSDTLPPSALSCGADIVIQSTHKTLPSLTQTSMIHVGSNRIDLKKLRDRYQLYTTTSPSYLFTLSNEMAVKYMDEEGRKILKEQEVFIQEIIEQLDSIDRVSVFKGDPKDDTLFYKDPTKILMSMKGVMGTTLKRELWRRHNIRLEMADYYYALALTSVTTTKEELLALVDAIRDLAATLPFKELNIKSVEMPKPKVAMMPAEAYYGKKTLVSLDDALGTIAAAPIIPYPPGVPLVATGERVTEEVLDHLQFLRENGQTIVGLTGDEDNMVVVE
ncbi:MAG: aminotransferase class I/II-fold pyridoxal phosphate-dependent enzyme [Tissierellia bacterium]|nr:aminotransferase class I/II-fold pyridoxal phosphate-dependent enzyme [Tissierellia bacterium]